MSSAANSYGFFGVVIFGIFITFLSPGFTCSCENLSFNYRNKLLTLMVKESLKTCL